MKIILGDPGCGKTKEILRLSSENNIPVLCESEARRDRLLVKADGYGISIPTPIVYTEVTPETGAVYVDDIKKLLETMLTVKIAGVSINIEDSKDLKKI